MLDAQLGLRQSLRENADQMESEDEENVIYVEGYEDDEGEDSDADITKNIDTPRTKAIRDQADISMIDEDDLRNEEDDAEEDDEEEDDEEGGGNILDIEAEESAGSSDAEESLDEDDEENEDDDADSAASMADFIADTEDDSDVEDLSRPPPSKKARLSQGGGKGKNKAGSGRK
jgi:U3 small nucleolar RNA-associated protein 5